MAWLRTPRRLIMNEAGALLVAFGALMLFDKVYFKSSGSRKAMGSVGLDELVGL